MIKTKEDLGLWENILWSS